MKLLFIVLLIVGVFCATLYITDQSIQVDINIEPINDTEIMTVENPATGEVWGFCRRLCI
ncbi:unnamed protein product [marine sediment metagenome]|uniref:Uncharacterized protein n=1 Tax=marine sediment metagenome TaxID=412755 RepID=X0U6X5_9ZZZZ